MRHGFLSVTEAEEASVAQQTQPMQNGSSSSNSHEQMAQLLGNGDHQAAMALASTFCHAEWMMLFQNVMTADQLVAHAVQEQMMAVLEHREKEEEQAEVQQPAAAAAAAATCMTPEDAEGLRQQAIQDANDKIDGAILSILAAQDACGRPVPELQEALRRLKDRTEPLAQGAADAQRLVHRALEGCPPGAEKAIKNADRDVRDIVALRCRACCADPKDRDAFLVKAGEAYEGDLDKEVRAQLLLSAKKLHFGFVSNNQVAAERRGGPRPPRRRHAASSDKKEDTEPMYVPTPDAEHPSDSAFANWNAYGYCLVPAQQASSAGASSSSAAASSSSCACAADPETSSCGIDPVKAIEDFLATEIVRGPEGLHAEADAVLPMQSTSRSSASALPPTSAGQSPDAQYGGYYNGTNMQAFPEFNPYYAAWQAQAQGAEVQYYPFNPQYDPAYNAQAAYYGSAAPAEVPTPQPPRNRRPPQQNSTGSKGSSATHYRL